MAKPKSAPKTARKAAKPPARPPATSAAKSAASTGAARPATGSAARPGAEAPRTLRAGPQRDKQAPTRRVMVHEQDSVSLEEVLVNFQRSLARATRSSLETARADLQVGMGQRALYVIDGIGVTLQAGVVMARDADGCIQAVSVDLGADPGGPGQARLEFRVASRPIEPMSGEQLVLADLDPLGLQRPSHRLRVTLIGLRLVTDAPVQAPYEPPAQALESVADEAPPTPPPEERILSPLPGRNLHLYVVGTTTGATEVFVVATNAVGQADVEIDALRNRVTSGERSAPFKQLDLTRKDSEFFVWAACKPELADGITANLTSNVLQYTVKRETARGVKT
jgi:hypothetical protein